MEVHRWTVICIENKIGKTQATLITFIFLIPGAITFTAFAQLSSSMYTDLFGTTQDPSDNPYLVTKLLPLNLGCTFAPFSINITGTFTPLQSQPEVLLLITLSNYNFLMAVFVFSPNNIYLTLITKEGVFIQI